jgi:threonine dehydratase
LHTLLFEAFKFRGASNAVMLLSDTDAQRGVCTHSSGNHAQALALAAKQRGIPAYVVMPNNSPEVKKAAVRGYGAQVIECEPTLQAREDTVCYASSYWIVAELRTNFDATGEECD